MTKRNYFRVILLCASLYFAFDEFRCDNYSRVIMFLAFALSAGLGIYADLKEKKGKDKE